MSKLRTMIASHRWALHLIVLALAVRLFAPVGYMPGPGGLMLCPAVEAPAIAPASPHAHHHMPGMDMLGMEMPGMDGMAMGMASGDGPTMPATGAHHDAHSSCPFALAASAVAPLPAVDAPRVGLAAVSRLQLPALSTRLPAPVEIARLARGPPATSA